MSPLVRMSAHREQPLVPGRLLAALGVGLLCAACGQARGPLDPRPLMHAAVAEAADLQEQGRPEEASLLLGAVRRVDPGHAGAAALRAELGPGFREITPHPLLGSSQGLRPGADRPLQVRALLYLPDRLLDLLDVLSLEKNLGEGVLIDVHATRGLQVALGTRHTIGYGLHSPRSVGVISQDETGVGLGPWGALDYRCSLVGTTGLFGDEWQVRGLHRPSDPLYQTLRDYWSIGTSLQLGLLGLGVELHPLQVADFVVGWLGVDFLHDDHAHTRRAELTPWQRELLAELAGARLPADEPLPASPARSP